MFNKIKDKIWVWMCNDAPYVISIILITLWWLFIYIPREIIVIVDTEYHKKRDQKLREKIKEMEDDG